MIGKEAARLEAKRQTSRSWVNDLNRTDGRDVQIASARAEAADAQGAANGAGTNALAAFNGAGTVYGVAEANYNFGVGASSAGASAANTAASVLGAANQVFFVTLGNYANIGHGHGMGAPRAVSPHAEDPLDALEERVRLARTKEDIRGCMLDLIDLLEGHEHG